MERRRTRLSVLWVLNLSPSTIFFHHTLHQTTAKSLHCQRPSWHTVAMAITVLTAINGQKCGRVASIDDTETGKEETEFYRMQPWDW